MEEEAAYVKVQKVQVPKSNLLSSKQLLPDVTTKQPDPIKMPASIHDLFAAIHLKLSHKPQTLGDIRVRPAPEAGLTLFAKAVRHMGDSF